MAEDELRALEQAFNENPRDAETAKGYERALRRAGDERRLKTYYTFQFECPRQWGELRKTSDPLVRECDQCQESVHLASTPESFEEHTALGHCVAVWDGEQTELKEKLAAQRAANPDQDSPECVVAGAWHDLLLDGVDLVPMRLGMGDMVVTDVEHLVQASGQAGYASALQEAHRIRREQEAEPEAPAQEDEGLVRKLRRLIGF